MRYSPRFDLSTKAMPKETKKLICVEASAAQNALIKHMGGQHGLEYVACKGEEATLKCLDDDRRYVVMVMAKPLLEGASFRLIETVRLSLQHAALPIAFVIGERNLALAHDAMSAGATEIFLRSEHESLLAFIGDCSSAPEKIVIGGKVLLVEDCKAQGNYIEHLCIALGMSVDRAQDVGAAEILFRRNSYQMVLVDIVLNGTKSGISLVKSIRQNRSPRQPILVMSGFDDLPRYLMALKSGADDFIRKPFSSEEFVWRIRKILQCYAYQDIGGNIPEGNSAPEVAPKKSRKQNFMDLLSPREAEICIKILEGTSDRDIAGKLGISFWTVRSHIQQIFAKTGALNRRELMVRFM